MKLTLAALLIALPNAMSRPDDDAPSLRANKTAPRELTILKDGRDNQGRILLTKNHRDLGKIDVSSLESALAGARAFLEGTNEHGRRLGPFENGNGDKFNPKNKDPYHVRFVQEHNGMEVEGASVVVHTDALGEVLGVNGEYVSTSKLPDKPTIGAGPAIKAALEQSRVPESEHSNCSQPRLTVVREPKSGEGFLSWTCTVRYDKQEDDGTWKPFKDQIFAKATGDAGLVTLFPKIYTKTDDAKPQGKASSALRKKQMPSTLKGQARRVESVPTKTVEKGQRGLQTASMNTQNCYQKTSRCSTVTTSSSEVNTGDLALDSAHNYARATYLYYLNNHGRNSVDGNGMTLISRVHYDRNYNNAFWDGAQMTYGDGDGSTFIPFSQDADVVGHELTHGVTEHSSNLVYSYESGALNEALSDIFGAMVDRQEGATGADIWKIGEDIYTPNTPGDALRVMSDPAAAGDYDWWPTRYTGSSDNGGVHSNSGIANLAFYLLAEGGMHPRGKSSVNVPGIGIDAAAEIFYQANVNCLTSGSSFAGARYCTADVFGNFTGDYTASVHAAWDAVGVPNDPPAPPPAPIELSSGVASTINSLSTGMAQRYTMEVGKVKVDETVTCTTTCNNGDADLYLRFGQEPELNPSSSVNACGSYSSNSNESCTTPKAPASTTFYASVQAYSGFSNLQIKCVVNPAVSCKPLGDSCSSDADCCSGNCKGRFAPTCK